MVPFNRTPRKIIFVFHCNYGRIFCRFRNKVRYWSKNANFSYLLPLKLHNHLEPLRSCRRTPYGTGRPSVVCHLSVCRLSVVCNVRAPCSDGRTFRQYFTPFNSSGTSAVSFLLKLWAKSRRDSRRSCKLNIRGYEKLAYFDHYIALFRKR